LENISDVINRYSNEPLDNIVIGNVTYSPQSFDLSFRSNQFYELHKMYHQIHKKLSRHYSKNLNYFYCIYLFYQGKYRQCYNLLSKRRSNAKNNDEELMLISCLYKLKSNKKIFYKKLNDFFVLLKNETSNFNFLGSRYFIYEFLSHSNDKQLQNIINSNISEIDINNIKSSINDEKEIKNMLTT
jgi:hypothetical protein